MKSEDLDSNVPAGEIETPDVESHNVRNLSNLHFDESNVYEIFSPSEYVAISIAMDDDLPRSINIIPESGEIEDSEDVSDADPPPDGGFRQLSDKWLNFTLGFFETAPMLGGMASYLHISKVKEHPVSFSTTVAVASSSRGKDENGIEKTIYVIPASHSYTLFKKIDLAKRHQRQVGAYASSQIFTLISQYEALFADILRIVIRKHPNIYISKETVVSAAEVIGAASLDTIKNKIIEDKIDNLLREGHVSQIEDLLKRLKIDPPDAILMRDFAEICERRNIITHANGIANSRYINKLKELKIPDAEIPKIGHPVHIDRRYAMRSNGRISLLGFWLIHSIWRKINPSEREASISALIGASHDMLAAGFTKISRRICRMALDNYGDMPDVNKAYLVVNLALSYHLDNDLDDAERKSGISEALGLRQWDIVDGKFALALCCLREDYGNLANRIDAAVADGVSIHNFMNWALFNKVRSNQIFDDKMMEHFSVDMKSSRYELDMENEDSE